MELLDDPDPYMMISCCLCQSLSMLIDPSFLDYPPGNKHGFMEIPHENKHKVDITIYSPHTYLYIYIHILMCVCLSLYLSLSPSLSRSLSLSHFTHPSLSRSPSLPYSRHRSSVGPIQVAMIFHLQLNHRLQGLPPGRNAAGVPPPAEEKDVICTWRGMSKLCSQIPSDA